MVLHSCSEIGVVMVQQGLKSQLWKFSRRMSLNFPTYKTQRYSEEGHEPIFVLMLHSHGTTGNVTEIRWGSSYILPRAK